MKKVIVLSIACFFCLQAAFAQGTTLESFFNYYAEKDGFTYIFYGKRETRLSSKIPLEIRYSFKSITFLKTLNCEFEPKDFLTNLREIVKKEQFELTKKIKNDNRSTEVYIKEIDDKIEYVEVFVGENTFVRWISGIVRDEATPVSAKKRK